MSIANVFKKIIRVTLSVYHFKGFYRLSFGKFSQVWEDIDTTSIFTYLVKNRFRKSIISSKLCS